MNTPSYIKQHGIKTKFRMLTQGYGIYRGIVSVENEEVILSTNTMSKEEILEMRPVNWFLYLFWNNGYYVEFMKFVQQLNINPIDYILSLMNNLTDSNDDIGKLYKDFLQESEEEWYDSPEDLFEANSKIIDGKLKAESFAKLNAKYTSLVIFHHKEKMAKKLVEVAVEILKNNIDKFNVQKIEKDIFDIVNFCSEKSINISDIRQKQFKQKKVDFIYDYPKWIKENNGETEIKKFNGGVSLYFYLSKEKKQRIEEAMEIHNYTDITEVHMKLIEVLHTKDLFYDIGYKENIDNSNFELEDKAITSWAQES